MVALELDLGLVAPGLDGLVEVAGPLEGIAHLGAAQGEDVVHGVGGVLGHPECLAVREPGVHLGRRFGAWGHLEDHPYAVQGNLFPGLGDEAGWQQQGGNAGGGGLPQAAIHASLGIARQQGAIHVDGTAGHGVAGDDVFRDRMLGEPFGGDDLNPVLFHLVRRVEEAGSPAVVIHVGVAVNHGADRPLAQGLVDEGEGRLGGLRRDQRVEDDPPLVTLDEGDVGEIEAADLVNLVGHLEQAVLHVQLGIAPQARVDGIRRRLVQADVGLVLLQIPHHVALVILDGEGIRFGDEAAPGILEILLVVEWQGVQHILVGLDGKFAGRLGVDDGPGRLQQQGAGEA